MKHGGNVWEGGQPDRWLDFSANLRPEGTPDWVMDAMREALPYARFYPDRALTQAREGLAAYLGVSPARVLPTAGGAAAIDLALSLSAGRVMLHTPTFGEYAERARVRGRAVADDAQAMMPGDTLVRCNPNNPTGEALEAEQVLALHARAAEAGATLLVDEAFADFCPECSVRHSLRPGLIVAGSLTKTLCIPGVRLGYVLAAPEVIGRLEARMLPWPLNMLAVAVCAALPAHTAQVEEDVRRNAQRRARFAAQLEAHGVQVTPSRANFLLADFQRDMTQDVAHLKRRGVLVRTCASFGLPESVLRLAVKREEENERLVRLLFSED